MDMEKRVLQQDEISLKELIRVMLNGKILIALITVGALTLSAFYTFFIASPSYESSALFSVNFRDSVVTPYGDYLIPFQTMDEYTSMVIKPETINRTLVQLDTISYNRIKSSISVVKVQGTNMFRLTATASSPELAYEIANTHAQSCLRQFNHTLGNMALADFSNSFSTQIKKDTRDLESNKIDIENTLQLLANTEKAISLENALLSQKEYALIYAAEGALDLSKIKGDRIITQELNPSYLALLERITALEIERNTLERNIEQATKFLEELKMERESLLQTMDYTYDDPFQSINTLVTIISHPEAEAQKIGPKNALNLAIGLVLGLMLGGFVTLFKAYWDEVI